MFHVKPVFRACLGMLLAVSGVALAAGDEVHFAGPGVELTAYLYRPEGKGPFPAVVMMHGCSGLYGKSGKPTRSYQFWAEHFRDRGFVTLLLDSFGPRGEREICTQKDRRISEATDRPRDAHAALDWLAGQPDVDPRRVNLMGWSNGGTTVLNTVKPEAPGSGPDGPRFHAAVAFYPGCSAFARTALNPTAPLLIQAGGRTTGRRRGTARRWHAGPWEKDRRLPSISTPERITVSIASTSACVSGRMCAIQAASPDGALRSVRIPRRGQRRSPGPPTGWSRQTVRDPVSRGTRLGSGGLFP